MHINDSFLSKTVTLRNYRRVTLITGMQVLFLSETLSVCVSVSNKGGDDDTEFKAIYDDFNVVYLMDEEIAQRGAK